MWKCPKCEATNYEKGACECGGYNGVVVTQRQYRITWPEVPSPSSPEEPWYYPKIWC